MKNFTDGLEKWVREREKQEQKRRQDASAVEFLAVKNDVKEAMEKGYALKTIWEYLKENGKVRYSYEAFRRHVKRYIKSSPKGKVILAAKITESEKQPKK